MEPIDPLAIPHRRALEIAASGAPIFLTVNPVEYHGPHLSLHNDRLIARGLCARIHAELAKTNPEWPFLLASDLEVGAEPCRGAGSRVIGFAEERALVLEAAKGLVELGAKRVVLMTFHGGPLHGLALDAGVRYFESHGVRAIAPLSLVLETLIEMRDPEVFSAAFAPIADPAVRARALAGIRMDVHAGFFETSMALALAPESVDPSYVNLPECPDYEPDPGMLAISAALRIVGRERTAREIELGAWTNGWGKLEPFPGYTGAPHLASRQSGEAFVAYALETFVPVIREVFDGRRRAPDPPFGWLRTLTLEGRLLPKPAYARES